MSRRADALADRCETAIKTVIDLIAGAIGHAEANRQSLRQCLSNWENVLGCHQRAPSSGEASMI